MLKKMKIWRAEFLLMKKMSNFRFFENFYGDFSMENFYADFANILSTGETYYCELILNFLLWVLRAVFE